MKSLLDLRRTPGQPISASDWNALLRWLHATQLRPGPGIRLARTPSGTIVTATPAPIAPSGPFLPALTTTHDGRQAIQFTRGLIAGVEPRIGSTPIGGHPGRPNDPPPALPLPPPDTQLGYIYAQCALDRATWRINSSEVIFLPEPPPPAAWTAHKLLALLQRNGRAWAIALRACHFNISHYPYGRKPNGLARHLWFAT